MLPPDVTAIIIHTRPNQETEMIIYRADGRIERHELRPPGREPTLAELQYAVGGYIEVVPGSELRAFCNEEGRLRGLPLNRTASERFQQILVGDVVELEPDEPIS